MLLLHRCSTYLSSGLVRYPSRIRKALAKYLPLNPALSLIWVLFPFATLHNNSNYYPTSVLNSGQTLTRVYERNYVFGSDHLPTRIYHIFSFRLSDNRTAVVLPNGHELPFSMEPPNVHSPTFVYEVPVASRYLRSSWIPVADAVLLHHSQNHDSARQELKQIFLGVSTMELQSVNPVWEGGRYFETVRIPYPRSRWELYEMKIRRSAQQAVQEDRFRQ